MPKLLYLTLSLCKSELIEYNQKFENNLNYDLLYPAPDKIAKIEPILPENEVTSVFVNENSNQPTCIKESGGITVFKNKSQLTLNNLGYVEKNNIYIFKDVFKLNEIQTNFLNRFANYSPNSLCWWCCYQLELGSIPIPLPVKYCEIKKSFRCKGLFCSFECSMAYCFKFKEGSSLLLNYLHKKMTGINMKDNIIKPAPPREILEHFGGIVNIAEFRKLVNKKTIYDLVEYPVIFTTSELREQSLQVVFKHENNNLIPLEDKVLLDANKKIKSSKKEKINENRKSGKSIRSMLKLDD